MEHLYITKVALCHKIILFYSLCSLRSQSPYFEKSWRSKFFEHPVKVIVLQQQVSVTFFALLVADDRRATCQRIFGNSMAIELGPYGFSDSKQQ